MPEAVSDSSTLIHLSAVSHFDLLHDFYNRVFIPDAVWREVVLQGADRVGVTEVRNAVVTGWLTIQNPTDREKVRRLRTNLDAGEAEAIALALEIRPDMLLIDEEFARLRGRELGLPITGAVGVLLRAKLCGKIDSLRTVLDQLRGKGGCYLGQSLYESLLKEAGE